LTPKPSVRGCANSVWLMYTFHSGPACFKYTFYTATLPGR
jgi:sulfur transfer protein SufE